MNEKKGYYDVSNVSANSYYAEQVRSAQEAAFKKSARVGIGVTKSPLTSSRDATAKNAIPAGPPSIAERLIAGWLLAIGIVVAVLWWAVMHFPETAQSVYDFFYASRI